MQAQVVSFHCVLKNRLGRVISSTYNQDVLTWQETAPQVLSGLAKGMQNLRKGEKRKITLSADQAYGFYDPEKVLYFSIHELPKTKPLHLGQTYLLRDQVGRIQSFRVTHIENDIVTLDGNHPLAGQDLIFEIEATDVREATREDFEDSEEPTKHQLLH